MHAVMGSGRLIAGRYRLQDPIGRGAMGIVWRGRDELLARDVAVKEVQITTMASPADAEVLYQRTLREARTAARLSHPNVVTVFDVVEENGSPWIVMELVNARSLDQVITEDGPLPPEQAAELGASLIGALSTAHAAGVLHRDVKPSNVLVAKDGRAVLTDFGIATFSEDSSLTQGGIVVGTPGFTAPERIRGEIATPASDLWSLGATLYAAVEGRGPFNRVGGSSVVTAGVAIGDAPQAPSAGPLGPVIDALLSRDPGTRPDCTTAARLLADAATKARTSPRPLRGGWLVAESGHEPSSEAGTENTQTPAGAGRLGASDSGFLDPPDYEALHIPAAPKAQGAEGTIGSGELAPAGAAAVPVTAGAVVSGAIGAAAAAGGEAPRAEPSTLDPASGPALWGPLNKKAASRNDAATEWAPVAPSPSGPGQGRSGFGDGRWSAAAPVWRSSGRWRLMVAIAGITVIVVAAFIGWNIFQHSGAVSALGNPGPGTASQPAGAGLSSAAAGGQGAQNKPAGPHTSSGSTSGNQGGAPASSGGASATPGPGSSVTPSPSASPSPTPTPSSPGTTPPVLPAGYRWHKFTAAVMGAVAGFKIGMPLIWTQGISGQVAHLNQVVRDFHLTVDLSYWVYATPLHEAQQLQRQAAATHKHNYKVIFLKAVNFNAVGGFRSASAAELKFSWHNATLNTNFTQLDLLVALTTKSGSQPYTFAVEAPSATFATANGVFGIALPTFRPLPGP